MSFMTSYVEYGCWISPENRVENGTPKLSNIEDECEKRRFASYADLYRSGYVEVRFGAGSVMEVWGLPSAIGRAKEIWAQLAASVEKIKLCTVKANSEHEEILDHEVGFSYPAEMADLENYLGLA